MIFSIIKCEVSCQKGTSLNMIQRKRMGKHSETAVLPIVVNLKVTEDEAVKCFTSIC